MVFDKSKVYTALNADELKVGSSVILADEVLNLRKYVEQEIHFSTLKCIYDEGNICRFEGDDYMGQYALAYLVKEPAPLEWTDLKVGDIIQLGTLTSMVTAIDSDPDSQYHVHAGTRWMPNDILRMYRKIN